MPEQQAASTGPRPGSEALGQSETFLEFMERLSRAAAVDRPVLLLGERGTGKELAAARLHYLSARWQGPFLTLNCAALTPSLIEAELFGHEAGAFTGAVRRRTGRFEAADGGTLFLDEIANIPLEVQEKILRVVEYGSFERVGGSSSISTNVRIIGATNMDLTVLVRQGRFKQDLLDRLSFEVLYLPPLRDREGDILYLANHFAARMAFELGREYVPEFSPQAVDALERHPWPGNVRELKNTVERAVYRTGNPVITRIIFDPFESPFQKNLAETGPDQGAAAEEPAAPLRAFQAAVREFEVRLLKTALRETRYNQKRAAANLGLTYNQFRGLYRKYRDELTD